MHPTLAQFARFCLVGTTGFSVDYAILEGLMHMGLPVHTARACSIALAMQVVYTLHVFFTFRVRRFRLRHWVKFISSNLVGASINYALFLLVLTLAPWGVPQWDRLSGVVIGTGVALFFNFWANRRFVFVDRRRR